MDANAFQLQIVCYIRLNYQVCKATVFNFIIQITLLIQETMIGCHKIRLALASPIKRLIN
jgi:hypothetical protein